MLLIMVWGEITYFADFGWDEALPPALWMKQFW